MKTLSESQKVMRWRIILRDFGPNIQNIAGVDNIASDTLSRLPFMPRDKYKTCKRKSQCRANDLFTLASIGNNKYCFQLNILIV